MTKVLKLNSISNCVNNILDKNYDLLTECNDPDIILVRSFEMKEYTVPSSLLAVGRAGAGVNNIPHQDYIKKGVVVFNSPGANANAVKELVITALLLSCRKIYEGLNWIKGEKGKGDEVKTITEKGKSKFVGGEIIGKTLGVIGLGAIGKKVAYAANALGMKVVGYDPFVKDASNFNFDIGIVDTLDKIYDCADFITIHTPYLPETKGFINCDAISKMKDNVVIINCARGELVDNKAIIEAINSKKVYKYFTDFPQDELLDIDGIIVSPHIGASTYEAEDNCAIMVAEELKDYVENGNIKNSVNFPALIKDKNGFRITILADSNPPTVSSISDIIKENSFDAVSAIKGNAFYVIIDKASKDDVVKFQGIDGVYRIRTID